MTEDWDRSVVRISQQEGQKTQRGPHFNTILDASSNRVENMKWGPQISKGGLWPPPLVTVPDWD